MINRILRLIYTLRYLKPGQLAFFVLRRKFPSKQVRYEGTPTLNDRLSLKPPVRVEGAYKGGHRFFFLNAERDLGNELDWSPSDVPRLWRYSLHYFDYLRDEACSKDHGVGLITSWIERNPQGSEPGWEPFTASLRIVNWVFFLHLNPSLVNDKILTSLYEQVLWLENNDERHILANHYFENLKALMFAGCFFEGDDAERWRVKGAYGVMSQLMEQTLADGGHYERTPQYHALMLENYLDLLNLSGCERGAGSGLDTTRLDDFCKQGLSFYHQILFPDGQPPLFNDTAFGIAPSIDDLSDYYHRVSGEAVSDDPQRESVELGPSGIFAFRNGLDMFVIDAGGVGPSYQPGHTHCDMLSYELMLSGQRIIVDTGVCEYEPGNTRKVLRSTRAHNTVSVDGAEQSEVWGEFRVARRAKILNARVSTEQGVWRFSGAYRGFHRVARRVEHHRTVAVSHRSSIESVYISDEVFGASDRPFESFVHLHPDVSVVDLDNKKYLLTVPSGLKVELSVSENVTVEFESSFYCPEFGLKQPNTRVVLKPLAVSSRTLHYTLRRIY